MRIILLFSLSFIQLYANAQDVFDLSRTGTVESMQAYLLKDPNAVNRLSDQGISPFILACYRGNNAVAKLLEQNGANVMQCTSEGSAIYGIIFKDNLEMLNYLLDKGYSPNDTCQFSQFGTPLHMAMNLKRYGLVESLLSHKASTITPDAQGRSLKDLLDYYKDPKLNTLFEAYEKN